MKPFIPSWIDDAQLSAAEFRVLCHLWRRADHKSLKCYPAAKSIMITCRISENTFWRVLRKLESRGLIRREKGKRASNLYTVIEFPPQSAPKETEITPASPQSVGSDAPQNVGCQSPQNSGSKGYPKKSIHLRESRKGELSLSPDWPDSIPEDRVSELVTAMSLPVDSLQKAYGEFRQLKLTFGDQPPRSEDDVWGIFMHWMLKSTAGRKLVVKLKSLVVADATDNMRSAEAISEPRNWQEVIADDVEDSMFVTWNWGNLMPYYQKRIAAKVRALESA